MLLLVVSTHLVPGQQVRVVMERVPTYSLEMNVVVNATDYKFTPRYLNISTGTTVTWINRSPTAHTSTENSTPPLWTSGNLDPSQNYSFTFTMPRVYYYYCGYHAGAPYFMTGVVNVTGQPILPGGYGGNAWFENPLVIGIGLTMVVAAVIIFIQYRKMEQKHPPQVPNLVANKRHVTFPKVKVTSDATR